MRVSDVHFAKVEPLRQVTDRGMLTSVRLVHWLKVPSRVRMPSGRRTLLSAEH